MMIGAESEGDALQTGFPVNRYHVRKEPIGGVMSDPAILMRRGRTSSSAAKRHANRRGATRCRYE